MVKKTNKIVHITKVTKKVTNEVTVPVELLKTNALNHDIMLSVLVVSVFINAFVLTGWIALQITGVYNSEVASFLFVR